MKVFKDINDFPKSPHLVLTLGVYDGVHVGHQEILKTITNLAKQKGGHSALLSFWPHPRLVLQENCNLKLLTMPEEKNEKLGRTGLDYHIIQTFNKEFSRQTSAMFVRDTLVNKLGVKTLIVGHDHHFGRNREGDFNQLKELAELYDFNVIQLEAILKQNKPISSTKIRRALQKGKLDFANAGLNDFYSLSGEVVSGDGIGLKLGYPTINIRLDKDKLVPKDGVYGVKVKINSKEYFGLLNIGFRPTVQGTEHRIEVFILDFNENVYGSHVNIKLLKRLRDEKKFDSTEALKKQIEQDIANFKRFLQVI